ncbi:hypothetical protein AJ79_03778 [Helicocarpus griseus UAMH5409]|uniref:Major facilitator superfamily (MFS) profile domain-containing protein n=1 Tax=Helicocarpus griseus UAMH5409 TaxID=1447875 RepID=A0A2B7XW37_9EURO|nr:hypothetical protein AJ79_03778 [Helicocarpus griseus UAMH5409]
MGMLIAGRTIQGVGAAGLVLLVNIILSDIFPIKERAKYMGLTNTSWAVAAAIGPLIGGAFAQNVTWRWCFYLNLPLNGVVFVLLLTCLRINQQKAIFVTSVKSIDAFGLLLIIGGTVMLLLGLQFGANSHSWSSATVICLISFGLLLMVLFLFFERILEKKWTQRPIIPVAIIKDRSVLPAFFCFWVHGIIGIAPYYFLPLFFQTVRGDTPLLSGVYILPMVVTAAVTTMATGIFAKTTGYIVEPIWAGFVLTTLGLGLFINLDPQSSWSKLITYQLIFGIGLGPNYSAPLLAVQRVVKPKDIAAVTSTLAFSRQLGSAFSLVIGGIIFSSFLNKELPTLVATLGSEATSRFLDSNAETNAGFINGLKDAQKRSVQKVYADSMRPMYYVYVALSGLALVTSLLIERGRLADEGEQDLASSREESQEKTTVKPVKHPSLETLPLRIDPFDAVEILTQVYSSCSEDSLDRV